MRTYETLIRLIIGRPPAAFPIKKFTSERSIIRTSSILICFHPTERQGSAVMDKLYSTASSHPVATVSLIFLLAYVSKTMYLEYKNPLRKIPGPWLARYTRFWLWKAVTSRNWHLICISLHRIYGKTPDTPASVPSDSCLRSCCPHRPERIQYRRP